MHAFCKGLLSLKENFFVPVWDTIEDLRHDGISIGNVPRTVWKKKALPRNFSARTENVPNSTSVCSITV